MPQRRQEVLEEALHSLRGVCKRCRLQGGTTATLTARTLDANAFAWERRSGWATHRSASTSVSWNQRQPSTCTVYAASHGGLR